MQWSSVGSWALALTHNVLLYYLYLNVLLHSLIISYFTDLYFILFYDMSTHGVCECEMACVCMEVRG